MMAPKKRASKKARENLLNLTTNRNAPQLDQGPTEGSVDLESQLEPQVTAGASRTTPYIWTEPAELFLIDELKSAIRRGERVENGFHPRMWDRIVARFPDEGLYRVSRTQLKSKHDSWKAKWKAFDQMATQSGWSVNEAGDRLTADDEAWDGAIVKWGTAARQFKGKAFKYRNELNEIFDGTTATGLYARVTANQRVENEARSEYEDELNNDIDVYIGDSDKMPRTGGDLGHSSTWPGFDESPFTALEPSTSATSVASTPILETPTLISNALKRKQRSADPGGRRVRQRGDDSLRRLVDAVVKRKYNIPGGKAKEEAVIAFQRDYEDTLEPIQFYTVLDRFNDPQNVITFNALKPGQRRDGWIQHLAASFVREK